MDALVGAGMPAVGIDEAIARLFVERDGHWLLDARLEHDPLQAPSPPPLLQGTEDRPADTLASDRRSHVHALQLPEAGSDASDGTAPERRPGALSRHEKRPPLVLQIPSSKLEQAEIEDSALVRVEPPQELVELRYEKARLLRLDIGRLDAQIDVATSRRARDLRAPSRHIISRRSGALACPRSPPPPIRAGRSPQVLGVEQTFPLDAWPGDPTFGDRKTAAGDHEHRPVMPAD